MAECEETLVAVKALVTPELMRWAREQMGFSLDEAARKIRRPVEDVAGWEDGSRRPTIPQLRKASEVYKRPMAVFYLPQPPKDFQTLRDFRRLPDSYTRTFSPELALLVRTASYRQEWLHEYLEEEGAEPLPFVGSISLQDGAGRVAADIRRTLEISGEEIAKSGSRAAALRIWIRKAEKTGIFVFRSGDVSPEEARGFALSDPLAPVVFINSKDAKAAQIFTLAHELAHIWLGHRSISNLEPRGQVVGPEANSIEVFCNQVAAEIILEPNAFRRALRESPPGEELEKSIESLSRRFKVSEEVIARRMLQEGLIGDQTYQKLRAGYRKRWDDEQPQTREGGPTYYVTKAAQNGHLFTRTIIGGFLSGTISGRDASELLNVKLNNFAKLGEAVGLPIAG